MTNLSSNLSAFGHYLDQPELVKKFNNKIPPLLITGAAGYALYDTYKSPKEEQNKKFIKNFSTLTLTILTALIATRGLKIGNKQIFEGLIELPHLHHKELNSLFNEINTKNKNSKNILECINKVRNNKILNISEIKILDNELNKIYPNQKMINKIIPPPHSHGPFAELKELSLLGLIPVLGGIAGGVIGDKLVKDNWKSKLPNKIKEGTYQYLNNIFLCNVGAGVGMLLMDKLNVKSKTARFGAMITGVVTFGLIAGNAIANFVGKNVINPIFDKEVPKIHNHHHVHNMLKDLNKERHPEALDLGLHVDDIASVGFLSGIKLIGPILPALYSISGYRAGIGYRNDSSRDEHK